MSPQTVTALPDTDIWRTPIRQAFNAPVMSPSEHASKPIGTFREARITFSFPSGLSQKFDQGGILLQLSRPGIPCHGTDLNAAQTGEQHRECKWLKAGIEYFNGVPMLSTVGCDLFADWSVVPASSEADALGSVTVAVKRDGEKTLWVYHVGDDGVQTPLREIAWFFANDDKAAGWELSVSAMAARPGSERSDALEVRIEDLKVQWEV